MISCDEALAILRAAATPLPLQTMPAQQAMDRVLGEAVTSRAWLPPFDNAAMDGFALSSAGQSIDAGTELRVRGWQAAGDAAQAARDGAWEIMTGARLPDGLDAVVPIEQVEVLERENGKPVSIRLRASVAPNQHVRRRGEDVRGGDAVLAAGTPLRAPQLMLLAALGIADVQVRRKPRVAIIATGHELVSDPAQPLQSGQIRDSNRPFLVAQLQAAGAEVAWQGVVGDDAAQFQRALNRALAQDIDLVLSSGAVSMGRYDFVPDALRARGARIGFHQVAIRPGKPLLFAKLAEGPLYFGLPGNPMASAVGQRFFVEPLLRQMLGLAPEIPLRARIEARCAKPQALRLHARASVRCDGDGQLRVTVLPQQESFRLMPMLAANAWAVLPEGRAAVEAGDIIEVRGMGHWQGLQLQEESA